MDIGFSVGTSEGMDIGFSVGTSVGVCDGSTVNSKRWCSFDL